jgi:mannose-6-phosphate isomerase-like protein (cupin superfamily)
MSNATLATSSRHYANPPQQEAADARTWITRGANFVVCISDVQPGAGLARENQADEYMVFLPNAAVTIEAGSETLEAKAETLTIVPPGASRITARSAGRIVRVFSTQAADLLALADNAAIYAQGAPEVAPLVPWPNPPAGFKLRNYTVDDYTKSDSNMRIFRSTNLMINVMTRRMVARDVKKLSPHSHVDFEQGSLALQGDWVHHMRYPWTADLNDWKADEHIEMSSPSLLVVPPKAIHTSRNTNDGGAWLLDIFAPPRVDFSNKPGMVCNADEYPMPTPAA